MNNKIKIFLFVMIFLSPLYSFSQEYGNAEIKIVARSYGDSITLRWATTTPASWSLCNKNGFIIERYQITKNGKPVKNSLPLKTVLTSEPIKPWPLQEWSSLVQENSNAAIAAQAIYGNSFLVEDQQQGGMHMLNKAQELESRFSFALFAADQSLKVAEASGLKFTDKNVAKGETYVYKVYSPNATTFTIDTGTVVIGTNENYPLPKPMGLKAEFSDKTVLLSWNKTYFENIYSTYIIERSSDNGITFQQVNGLPIANVASSIKRSSENFYRIDSLPENNKKYLYRVRGITIFEEISAPSEAIEGMGISLPEYITPTISSVKNEKDGSIVLYWQYPQEYNHKLKEFEILRSDKANGDYTVIGSTPSIGRNFRDSKPNRVNYYILRAKGVENNSLMSFPALGQLIDSIPPEKPTGIIAEISSSGVLNLKWKKGKDEDLLGYKVYMANHKEEEFTLLSKNIIQDTLFIDSVNLNTLTDKIYFKVMALDLNYNHSGLSEAIEIKRPDKIPPVAPLIENYSSNDSSIYIKWIPSSSNDVVMHLVYRREKGTSLWKVLDSFTISSNVLEFSDKNAVVKKAYEYTVTAKDDVGLESEKKHVISASLVDFGFRNGITKIEYNADRLKKQIELTWEYEGKPEKFSIYRAKKGVPLRIYKTINGSERAFIDKDLSMNTVYIYRIKALFSDGGQSPFSKEIEIKY